MSPPPLRRFSLHCLLQFALCVSALCLLAPVALATGPEIDVTPTTLDLGLVGIGNTASGDVTISEIRNSGTLTVSGGDITGTNAGEFEFINCTNPVIPSSGSCMASVALTPSVAGSLSAVLTVNSDASVDDNNTVALSGTGKVLPTVPALIFPKDGRQDLSTKLTFVWEESESSDGEDVTYTLFVCEDETFDGCDGVEVSLLGWGAGAVAGLAGGAALLVAGLWVPGIRSRRTVPGMLLVACFVSAIVAGSCSDSGGGSNDYQNVGEGEVGQDVKGLDSNTTYYWKVVVEDSDGLTIESDTYSFKTK